MGDVVQFQELTQEQQVAAGGKGGTLARLYRLGYPVPDGFVIFASAFEDGALKEPSWDEIRARLEGARNRNRNVAFAVRSSASSEDSSLASFAGEFESVLNVKTASGLQEAIKRVHSSQTSERVKAYGKAKGVVHDGFEMAIVVQEMVHAELSGVLFTVDPLTRSRDKMVGNFVYGLGDQLVSGEANPETFSLLHPGGAYEGPAALRAYRRVLFKLASQLETELGEPQDIEWALAGGKIYLLQSRPITTLVAHNPATGEWNDSLAGDFLWTNTNFGEAIMDVMTPATWSLLQIYAEETLPFKFGELSFAGNIGGRLYNNLSVLASMVAAMGLNYRKMLENDELFGRVPEGIEIPIIPVNRWTVFREVIPSAIRARIRVGRLRKSLPDFIARTPEWVRESIRRVQVIQDKNQLVEMWVERLEPAYRKACKYLQAATGLVQDPIPKLRKKLHDMVGPEDANILLSGVSEEGALLSSLGPVVGVSRVARGEMSLEDYQERYGHRGPHEIEISFPRPAEDPTWIDQQRVLLEGIDVDALLTKQKKAHQEAFDRFVSRYPGKVGSIRKSLGQVAFGARTREAARSELTRVFGAVRAFYLQAGKLTDLGEDVFFLSVEELKNVLLGEDGVIGYIEARRETHRRCSELPPYPGIIRGWFDPFEWAADENRRPDIFDATAPVPVSTADVVIGLAGAAGRVEGIVRRIDRLEDGDQLRPGEILVTQTTNVGWTPLFPRAAAVVTDVGAPLSHAAIVARELGVPAVVGCGDATTRLQTGDRVIVDGGKGIVEIVERK